MAGLKIYSYAGCGTCKKALSFLKGQGVAHEIVPIVERPPSLAELKRMLEALKERGLGLNKLFNTSGELYREMKMGEKLKTLTEKEALALLASHGKLIKRPFALGDGVALIGFKEEEWQDVLGVNGGKSR